MTLNLLGTKIGRLTVVAKSSERSGKSIMWHCHCLCGNTSAVIAARDLLHGNRKGCGACKDTDHPLYRIWRGIIIRCEDPNSPSYKDYGGRGIKICERWRNEFLFFVQDVGERKSIFFSLDRKDVNGNYEPGNVRWADAVDQANNKREQSHGLDEEQIIYAYRSKEEIGEIAKNLGVSEKTVRNIKARSYSTYATEIIVNHIIQSAKKKLSDQSPTVARSPL